MNMKYLFLSLVMACCFNQSINAQAYDGLGDYKVFIGYANVGGISGAELQFDRGFGDLASFGGNLIFLFDANKTPALDEFESSRNAFDSFNLDLFIRFHLSEAFKLDESIDPYLGIDLSLKSLGVHCGLKYNFSETMGVYIQYSQSLSGSFMNAHNEDEAFDDSSFINYFGKKGSISGGITINIF